MKNYILIAFALWSFTAQSQELKPLMLGNTVPDNFWQQEHSVYQNGKTAIQTLAAYKGKLLVLDFWASWCAPCVSSLPKLKALNQEFEGQATILSVSYQSEKELAPLATKVAQLKTLVNERYLHQLFPHTYLPHLVWISAEGKVLAITGQEALSAAKLMAALKGSAPKGMTKTDSIIPFEKTKWLLAQQNANLNSQLEFTSTLTRHLPGFAPWSSFKQLDSAKGYRFVATNYSILGLFVFAHSDLGISNFSYVINKVKAPINIITSREETNLTLWNKLHTYNFEFAVAQQLAPKQADFFELLRKQLAFYFPAYQCQIILQKKKCWALTATGPLNSIISKGDGSHFKKSALGYDIKNFSLKSLVKMLNMNTFQKSEIPLIDDTHFTEKVDMNLIADMGSIEEINKALASYNLQFVSKDMEVPYLLVTDKPTN